MHIGEVLLIGLVVMGALSITYKLTAPFRRPYLIPPQKKTVLDEALEEDLAPKVVSPYTWEEFQRDIHDGGLTFREIWEKCGGVMPKKPSERKAEVASSQIGSKDVPFTHLPMDNIGGPSGCSGIAGYDGNIGCWPASGSLGAQGYPTPINIEVNNTGGSLGPGTYQIYKT